MKTKLSVLFRQEEYAEFPRSSAINVSTYPAGQLYILPSVNECEDAIVAVEWVCVLRVTLVSGGGVCGSVPPDICSAVEAWVVWSAFATSSTPISGAVVATAAGVLAVAVVASSGQAWHLWPMRRANWPSAHVRCWCAVRAAPQWALQSVFAPQLWALPWCGATHASAAQQYFVADAVAHSGGPVAAADAAAASAISTPIACVARVPRRGFIGRPPVGQLNFAPVFMDHVAQFEADAGLERVVLCVAFEQD